MDASQERISVALATLEKNTTALSDALVYIYKRKRALERNKPSEANARLSEPRLLHCIKLMDIQAKGYLRLVTNLDTEKAFATLIMEQFLPEAWDLFGDFSGTLPIRAVPPTPSLPTQANPAQLQADRFRERAHHWIMKGYERLKVLGTTANIPLGAPEPDVAGTTPRDMKSKTRKAVIEPLLEKRTWTPNQWATKAGVHPSIVYDFLAGKSNLRPKTRSELASALGIDILDFPR
jgi:hypothetical protein